MDPLCRASWVLSASTLRLERFRLYSFSGLPSVWSLPGCHLFVHQQTRAIGTGPRRDCKTARRLLKCYAHVLRAKALCNSLRSGALVLKTCGSRAGDSFANFQGQEGFGRASDILSPLGSGRHSECAGGPNGRKQVRAQAPSSELYVRPLCRFWKSQRYARFRAGVALIVDPALSNRVAASRSAPRYL